MEELLKRDRAVVMGALLALVALAWAYLVWLNGAMSASAPMPSMPDMDMPGMAMPVLRPWTAADLGFTFIMWAVMMVGMMTPSVAPMILLYAQVGRRAQAQGKVFAPTGWFLAGYLLSWTGFAGLATLAQAGLVEGALLTPMLQAASQPFAALLLIAAGVYQWTPLKASCLSACQSPLVFLQRQGGFRRDAKGAVGLGLAHGAYCIGCCWALMTLLFVGGVMNVAWIAGLSVLVLLEKIIPRGQLLARVAGLVLIVAGAIVLYRMWT